MLSDLSWILIVTYCSRTYGILGRCVKVLLLPYSKNRCVNYKVPCCSLFGVLREIAENTAPRTEEGVWSG
jgi:hypothetical protein